MHYRRFFDFKGNKNRGWVVHRISLLSDCSYPYELGFKENNEVAYININYIPKKRFDIHYKSLIDYLHKIEGKTYLKSISDIDSFKVDYYEDAFEKFKKYHVDFPFTSYIKVREDFRRCGIATELYIHSGKWMNELGLRMHSSCLIRDCAIGVWKKMYNKGIAEKLPRRSVDNGSRYYIL